jgi:predicted nucleic acid-binding protein
VTPLPGAAVVVDASVAIKWALEEADSVWARGLVADGAALLAPSLLWTECANALWRIARRSGDGFDPAVAFTLVCESALVPVHPDLDLHERTFRLSRTLDHPSYDCLYVALAQRRGAALATADRRLIHVIRRTAALPRDRLLTPPGA